MRTDDYKNAITLAQKDLSQRDPKEVASMGGAEFHESFMEFEYIHAKTRISFPLWEVSYSPPKDQDEYPLTDQVLVLHYFQGAKNLPLTGELMAYRQIPGGEFYNDAFRRRAEAPLAAVFGGKPGLLTQASEILGGTSQSGYGDEAAIFRVFPHIDILVMIYHQDEEFESYGQVLFDRVIGQYLTTEDISWLGSAVVYRLMGIAKGL
ncbi:MAG: DUF3786 domain-containing protein [Deltaproteobacteria bacterium]|jgi:hypothetical protein|nr:DUF3786 domain-containing protein [Deltaproteobacteria bacterium]